MGFSIFNVYDEDRESHIHQVMHGIAGIKRLTSGQDFPKLNSEQGDQITWTQEYFGGAIEITKAMRKFDRYNQIAGLAKGLTEDAFDKVDQSLADRILNGWVTSYTDVYGDTVAALGPDGKCLFHAAHTNALTTRTYSNIISDGTNTNPPLSRQAIVYMRAQGKKHKDPNNLLRAINYDTLVVGPELEDEALRIANSEYLPGTNNNDKNPLFGKIKVIVWDRLAATSTGVDCDAYWFLLDSVGVNESLQCIFSERPSLDAPTEIYDNKNWEYTIDFFYTIGVGYEVYISGSKGDKS